MIFNSPVLFLLSAILLLALSAFASSSETAFFSLNRFQLRRLKETSLDAYNRIRKLLRHPTRLLIMILLINELVNITFSSLITELLQRHGASVFLSQPFLTFQLSGESQTLIIMLLSLLLTLTLLLIFGEITPKFIAIKINRIIAMISSRFLIILYAILYPILWILDANISFMLRTLRAEGRDHLSKTISTLSEEDFITIMEEGHREGTVHHAEQKLIKNVLEFDDSTAAVVMTPIQQAFSVPANAKILEVLPEIQVQKYSRVPVYQGSKQNIVGILYLKDLLALKNHSNLNDLDIRSLMTRPMLVGPNVRLSVLFRRFKEAKTHMAVVVNRSSKHLEGALGVITMEDVLESIFGEITDERDLS